MSDITAPVVETPIAPVVTEEKVASSEDVKVEDTLLTSEDGTTDDASKVSPGKEDTPARIVPEEYADFNLPEGSVLKTELVQDIKEFAKKRGFTQEEAQEMADMGAKHVQQMAKDQQVAIDAARTEWAASAKADKEFGGDAFTANLAVAKAGMKAHVTTELQELLRISGLGNHPEIIRHFYRLGKSVKDDTPDTGSPVAAGDGGKLDKLYPSRKKS